MIPDGRKLTTLVMFALFATACILAYSLPAKAAFMPLLIGIPGAILCAAQFAIDLRRGRKPAPVQDPEADSGTGDGARSEAEVFGWLALFTAAILGFGFIVGGPIVVGAFVRYSSRDSWRNALIAAVGTFAVLYFVFSRLLELSLFQGFVLEALLP